MKSISSLIKEEISKISDKQKLCCCFSALYGMMLCGTIANDGKIAFSTNVENANFFKETCCFIDKKKKINFDVNTRKVTVDANVIKFSTIAEIKSIFKCKNCMANFLKGIFIFYGLVADPDKMYRMDISISKEEIANELLSFFNNDLELNFKLTTRKNKYIVYTKDCETITSFLGFIGANSFAYEMINGKIKREIRNVANRVTNCDSANINRSIIASQKYCEIINKIINEGHFKELPDDLKEIAIKRIELSSLSLVELGKKFNPPLSKTVLYRKLEKIIKFYEKIKEE